MQLLRMAAVLTIVLSVQTALAQQAAPRREGAVVPRNQTGVDPRLAGAQALTPRAPAAPPWYPQPAEHQKYVTEVLGYWSESSAQIERYKCEFTRWEYDPNWIKPDPKTGQSDAIKISSGEIKFGKPDKGLFRVTKTLHYSAPKTPGEEPEYLAKKGEVGEHWVCDGKSVYEFSHEKKTLVEYQLPPEMHGKAIVEGPLPFLFGADMKTIQERYWVGITTPPGAKNEYWLEAWPKRREDAQNYKYVQVIIAEEDFLPKAMQIFQNNGASTVLTFEKREVNFDLRRIGILDPLHWTEKEFIEPNKPFGYKKEVHKHDAASGQAKQAARPQLPVKRK